MSVSLCCVCGAHEGRERCCWPMPRIEIEQRTQGNWNELCACKGADVSIFYGDGQAHRIGKGPALELCGECPVSGECLAHALRHEEHGIWAGTDGPERIRLRHVLGIPFRYGPGSADTVKKALGISQQVRA